MQLKACIRLSSSALIRVTAQKLVKSLQRFDHNQLIAVSLNGAMHTRVQFYAGGMNRKVKTDPKDPHFRDKRLFVRNLPADYTSFDLKQKFAEAGAFYASISEDENGVSKRCGIVQFETVAMADKALQEMNGMVVLGKQVWLNKDMQERKGSASKKGKNDSKSGQQTTNVSSEVKVLNIKNVRVPHMLEELLDGGSNENEGTIAHNRERELGNGASSSSDGVDPTRKPDHVDRRIETSSADRNYNDRYEDKLKERRALRRELLGRSQEPPLSLSFAKRQQARSESGKDRFENEGVYSRNQNGSADSREYRGDRNRDGAGDGPRREQGQGQRRAGREQEQVQEEEEVEEEELYRGRPSQQYYADTFCDRTAAVDPKDAARISLLVNLRARYRSEGAYGKVASLSKELRALYNVDCDDRRGLWRVLPGGIPKHRSLTYEEEESGGSGGDGRNDFVDRRSNSKEPQRDQQRERREMKQPAGSQSSDRERAPVRGARKEFRKNGFDVSDEDFDGLKSGVPSAAADKKEQEEESYSDFIKRFNRQTLERKIGTVGGTTEFFESIAREEELLAARSSSTVTDALPTGSPAKLQVARSAARNEVTGSFAATAATVTAAAAASADAWGSKDLKEKENKEGEKKKKTNSDSTSSTNSSSTSSSSSGLPTWREASAHCFSRDPRCTDTVVTVHQPHIDKLLTLREKFRAEGDFVKADNIRSDLRGLYRIQIDERTKLWRVLSLAQFRSTKPRSKKAKEAREQFKPKQN
jgi:RNA recognition motif-containing protein